MTVAALLLQDECSEEGAKQPGSTACGLNDRGVLVLCDPRVKTKNYGAAFLDSLPPMRRTEELAEVVSFFEHETTGD